MLDLNAPPPHPLVAVSILSADFGAMAQECTDVLAKGADLLHVDVMDGHFAPNLTMGSDMVKGVRRHLPGAFLDVHMMVERPDEYLDRFADGGANNYSFHLEVCKPLRPDGLDAGEMIDRIRARKMHAGMVINPQTPPDGLVPYLDRLDLVLIMSVHPGFSGQVFMPEVLPKAKWVKERIGPRTRLEIDGGINTETAKVAVAAGIDTMVTASALFSLPREKRAAYIDQLHHA